MPELRKYLAAGCVDLLGNAPPSLESIASIEARDIRIEPGDGMIHIRSLGDDERDAAFRATTIICGYVGAWNASGRMRARHRGHHDAVGEGESLELKRAKKRFGGTIQNRR